MDFLESITLYSSSYVLREIITVVGLYLSSSFLMLRRKPVDNIKRKQGKHK